MVKKWLRDGSMRNYGNALRYTVDEPYHVADIHGLSALLFELEPQQDACIVRGAFKGYEFAAAHVRELRKKGDPHDLLPPGKTYRLAELFEDRPLHAICVDIDNFVPECGLDDVPAAINEFVRTRLPSEFHEVSYHYQLSNSFGHPTKAGHLRAHVWFWLKTPYTSAALKNWARTIDYKGDPSLLNTVQIHYTGAPVFEPGVDDPVEKRSGFVQGLSDDKVDLVLSPTALLETRHEPNARGDSFERVVACNEATHETIADLRSALAHMGKKASDDRETWVDVLHHLYCLGGVGRELSLEWSILSDKFDAEDFERVWASCANARSDYRAVFKKAREQWGWINPRAKPTANHNGVLIGPERSRPSIGTLTSPPAEPATIIENYMLEDAGGMVASGGTGKTTIGIFESVHIILGQPLYGREIKKPGAVLFISAEDNRAVIESRLNRVCSDLFLTEDQIARVCENFYIEDVSATAVRLVSAANGDMKQTEFADEIIEKYLAAGVVYVHIDPTSLLGPGEIHGNDGMAELMRVSRRISAGLRAAVRLIHHETKAGARSEVMDQYAGRGGSAFADNSRFQQQVVRVKSRRLKYEGVNYELPAVISDSDVRDGNVLAIFVHKLSYQRRPPGPIFLLRRGFRFEHYDPVMRAKGEATSAEARLARVGRVVSFLIAERDRGLRHGRASIENHLTALDMSRAELRAAIDEGVQTGRIEQRQDETRGAGRKPQVLIPVEPPL
jgi:hypothetical protein